LALVLSSFAFPWALAVSLSAILWQRARRIQH
jgi:hypothetical protein